MTLILDMNLLLIAVFDSYNEHPVALAWFESIMNDSPVLVGLPVHSLLTFIRLATASIRPSGTSFRPLSMADALEQVEIWTAQPNVFVPQPAREVCFGLGMFSIVRERRRDYVQRDIA